MKMFVLHKFLRLIIIFLYLAEIETGQNKCNNPDGEMTSESFVISILGDEMLDENYLNSIFGNQINEDWFFEKENDDEYDYMDFPFNNNFKNMHSFEEIKSDKIIYPEDQFDQIDLNYENNFMLSKENKDRYLKIVGNSTL